MGDRSAGRVGVLRPPVVSRSPAPHPKAARIRRASPVVAVTRICRVGGRIHPIVAPARNPRPAAIGAPTAARDKSATTAQPGMETPPTASLSEPAVVGMQAQGLAISWIVLRSRIPTVLPLVIAQCQEGVLRGVAPRSRRETARVAVVPSKALLRNAPVRRWRRREGIVIIPTCVPGVTIAWGTGISRGQGHQAAHRFPGMST